MVQLVLTARTTYPAFLAKATEIANAMLAHAAPTFEAELNANSVTATRLRDVAVESRHAESALYGWTARSAKADTIFVNEVLRDRLDMIAQENSSHEYQCVVFMVAAVLFHESAHLTLRWKGILDSPTKYGNEVGNYMERKLFDGQSRLKIQKSTSVISRTRNIGTWTRNMAILDVVIEQLDGMKVIRADHLNKFFTRGKLDDKALFPLELTTYRRTKGATAHHGGGRKRRRRRPAEDPTIMIPFPLCGISMNRYVKRKLSVYKC
uniref:Uncharacterized protein n=1 Tax=Globisporangium ultimum (strain ATCC 200006 / CBS 805.95 / DAOM BR144) TaxID=431595 RepID=K3WVR9_GLOUD